MEVAHLAYMRNTAWHVDLADQVKCGNPTGGVKRSLRAYPKGAEVA